MKDNTIFYIEQKKDKKNTAGAKAPEDIVALCCKRGYTKVEFERYPKEKSSIYKRLWTRLIAGRQWKKLKKLVGEGDVVIFQHPSYGKRTAIKWIKRIQRLKRCKFIVLIHDLESLRGGIPGVLKSNIRTNEIADTRLLKCFDAVICHNEQMKKHLVLKGLDADRIVCLEIFDYLSDCKVLVHEKGEKASIAIAGNLAIGKCSYIYRINREHNKGLIINLFGNNYEKENETDNMIWHGSFKPEELPLHLKGDFGLVWDGTEAYTCAGNTGEYLRYNNPHKTSLYLSSGLPVIVWKEAAIAEFILKNRVGLVVDSLYNLENTISSVNTDEYEAMCRNVRMISERLHSGYYFYKALDEAMIKCNDTQLE